MCLCCLLISILAPAILPTFRDITDSARVNFRNQASHTTQKYLPETMGGGVAMIDYDGDGYLDLFFVNGAALRDPMPPNRRPDKSDPRFWNRLYHNNGDGTFTDVTVKAGVQGSFYGMGVAVGDYDNDGHPDLYVTGFGSNALYRNNGNGTFTDVTGKAGVAGAGWSTGAGFLDYDKDGLLDLVVARYLEWDFPLNIWCGDQTAGRRSYCHPDHFKPATHLLYHNQGDGTFRDVSKASGIGGSPGKGLGVAFNDYDGDGWPDILIANDSFPQQLFRNRHDGTFEEVGLPAGIAYDEQGQTFAGMGLDFEDYDNDGWPDAFINALSYQKYSLYRNNRGVFEYVSGPSGVGRATLLHSGWGAKLVDYDNDGWKDLFVGQGHSMDTIQLTQPSLRYLEPLLLMRNLGGRFEDVSERSGEAFRVPWAARGVAFGDLDNDGSVDVVVNSNDQRALILRNQGGNHNHWLLVNLIGKASNRDGLGAQIRIVSESGMVQHATASTSGSYLSANDRRVHFGLGQERLVKLLEISWPSGTVQRMESVRTDQILTVHEIAQTNGPAGSTSKELAERHHNLGTALLSEQKRAEAIVEFEKALQIDPSHLSSHFMLGRAYSEQRQFDAAISHLEIVRRLAPEDTYTLFYLCDAYFHAGRGDAALQTARTILTAGGENPRIQYALGVILAKNGRPKEGAEALERAVSSEPSNADALYYLGLCRKQTGQVPEAKNFFTKALAANSGHGLASYELSRLLIEEGNYDEARRRLQELARLKDYQFQGEVGLGRLFLELEKPDLAEAHVNRALALRPASAEVYYHLGMLYFQRRDGPEAARRLLQALKIDPDYVDAWALFGSVCLLERARSDAIRAFERCVALRPASARYFLLLGSAFLEDEKRQQALDQFQRAHRLSPQDPMAAYYVGLAMKKLERNREAIAFLRQAAQADRTNIKARYELADSLIVESALEEAGQIAHAILADTPNHAGAHYALGRIDSQRNQYADAVSHLEEAVRLDPRFLSGYYLLGQTYLKVGKPEQSRAAFERFRRLSEEDRAARQSARRRLIIEGEP